MLIIPVIFLLLFTFGLVYVKRRGKIYKDISIELSHEELGNSFVKISKRLGLPRKIGKGVEIKPIEKEINGANRIVKRKIKKGEYEDFEKVFNENYYLFKGYFKSKPDELFSLPHINNVPRIVIFSRALIATTKGKITEDRLSMAVSSFLENTEFSFSECEKMRDAIKYAVVEKVCEVANIIKSLNKLKNLSTNISFVSRGFVESNLYIYFVKKYNPALYFRLKKYIDLSNRAKNPTDVFNNLSKNLNDLINNLVFSMKNAENVSKDIYKILPQYKVLSEISAFKLSTDDEKKEYLDKILKISDKDNILESECASNLLKEWGEGLPVILFKEDDLKERAKTILKDIGVYFLSFIILPFEIIFNFIIFIKTIFNIKRNKKVR